MAGKRGSVRAQRFIFGYLGERDPAPVPYWVFARAAPPHLTAENLKYGLRRLVRAGEAERVGNRGWRLTGPGRARWAEVAAYRAACRATHQRLDTTVPTV